MTTMNAALAGRICVWVILSVIAYGLLIIGVPKLLAWVSSFYPEPMKYEGRDLTPEQLRAVRAWEDEEDRRAS